MKPYWQELKEERMEKTNATKTPKLNRCLVCGSTRTHIYPHSAHEHMALCLACGAHYHPLEGWKE